MYGTRQRECSKRAAAASENTAPCAPSFSRRVHRTLMAVHRLVKCRNSRIAAPFAVKMQHIHRIAVCLSKSAAIPYFGTSRANPETNHKSVTRFLTKERRTNLTNCFIFTHTVRTCKRYVFLNLNVHTTVH